MAKLWLLSVVTLIPLRFFGHSRSTITLRAEFVLFSNMPQQNHIIALTLAY